MQPLQCVLNCSFTKKYVELPGNVTINSGIIYAMPKELLDKILELLTDTKKDSNP